MLKFLILFLLLLSGSIFMSVFFKKKIEQCIPIYFIFIIVILYLFYIFNLLKLGLTINIAISLMCYLSTIIYVIKTKKIKEVFQNIITPGLLCFSLLYAIIYYLTKDSIINLFDELRLWGAYPKVLYFTDSLQLKNTLLYDNMSMNTYLPGMPLFQYYFLEVLGNFKEGYLHFAYCLLGISLFLPVLNRITWKKVYLILPFLLIVIFTPMIFYNNGYDGAFYYKNLFIDPILGLAIGFNFYLLAKNPYKNNFNKISFVLSTILVCILKENGFIFAFVSVFFSIILELVYYKNRNYKNIKNIFNIIVPIIIIILTFFSWKIVLNINNVVSDVTSDLTIRNIVNLFTNPTFEQKEIFRGVITRVFNTPLVKSNFEQINTYFTYKNIFVFYVIIISLIILLVEKEKRLKYSILGFAILIQSLLYLFALSLLYILNYKSVLCFERYNNTSVLGIFLFIVLILFELTQKNKKISVLFIVFISLIVIIPIRPIGQSLGAVYNFQTVTNDHQLSIKHENLITSKIKNNEDTINVYYVTYEQYPILHHKLYFMLLDDNIKIKNVLGNMVDMKNINTFVNYLKYENFEYIYVVNYDIDIEQFSKEIFSDSIKENSLYKIYNKDDSIILKEV